MLKQRLILVTLMIVGIIATLQFGPTGAFFSDLEQSVGNFFRTAEAFEFDLFVNGQDDPASVVVLTDLKPGDNRIVEKILRVNGNQDEAKIYMHLKNLEAAQATQTEPEIREESEPTPGPKSDIQNYIDYDLTSNDTVIIDLSNQILLPDAISCWIPLGTVTQNVDISVLQGFHFHENVTNWAQGDMLTFTEEFLALSTDAPEPGSPEGSDQIWDPITKTCITNQASPLPTAIPTPLSSASTSPLPSFNPSPIPSSEPFVDGVSQVLGTFGHCCDVNNLSSDPLIAASMVLGPPDSPPDQDFIQISDNSSLTFEFINNQIIDGIGADLRLYTYDTAFPQDALIEVSDDCVTYQSAGVHSDSADVDIDLNTYGLSMARCVRITDQVAAGDPYPTLGFDLDAIEALNSIPIPDLSSM